MRTAVAAAVALLLAVAAAILADPGVAPTAADRDLDGLRVAISAGGTREHLDPVRFMGNSSSGLMGWSLARAAALRGADVTLVAANVELAAPPGTEVRPVTSTSDLAEAMTKAAADADIVDQIKDLIEGKRLSGEIEDNVAWREARVAQETVPEADLVAKVKEILAAQAEDRQRAQGN